jgi:hypothetical protein
VAAERMDGRCRAHHHSRAGDSHANPCRCSSSRAQAGACRKEALPGVAQRKKSPETRETQDATSRPSYSLVASSAALQEAKGAVEELLLMKTRRSDRAETKAAEAAMEEGRMRVWELRL